MRTKASWTGFFDELKDRDLKDVELVVSDGHKGIQAAASSRFLGATWQMCQVHFSRAVMNNIPNKDKEAVAEKLRQGFEDPEKEGISCVSQAEEVFPIGGYN